MEIRASRDGPETLIEVGVVLGLGRIESHRPTPERSCLPEIDFRSGLRPGRKQSERKDYSDRLACDWAAHIELSLADDQGTSGSWWWLTALATSRLQKVCRDVSMFSFLVGL